MNRCVQEPQKIGKTGERNMSDDVMAVQWNCSAQATSRALLRILMENSVKP